MNKISNPSQIKAKRPISSLLQKNLMALSGLFLCLFLVIHLIGNLQLLLPEERARLQFNWYAEFLSNLLFIKVISYVLYLSILGHALMALWIGIQSRKAQGKTRYAYDRRARVTAWYHRHMELLGVVLLLFIIIHMKDFWFVFQFGELPLDEGGHKDLYEIVVQAFGQLWYVLLYVLSVIALGYHLLHGFFAAFRSLGLFHSKFSRWVYYFGWFYTAVMTLGFNIIPIYIYFTQS